MIAIAKVLLFAILVVIAAAVGAAVTFFGAIFIGILTGASQMEGALAMGAASLMPMGAVAGALIGIWLSWKLVRRLDDRSALGGGFGLTILVAGSVAGYFFYEDLTDGNPYSAAEEPTVFVEWRLPDLVPQEQIGQVYRHSMRSSYMNWTLNTGWDEPYARDEDGRTILRLWAKIRWRVNGRRFQLWKAPYHDDRMTVDFELGKDPPATAEYGPWQDVKDHPGHAFRTRVHRD